MNDLFEKVVALCKRRGFIFQGSEIYGGLAGTWDYGPAGSLLKKNLKDNWWKELVQMRDDVVGVDAAIMMNPKAWEASGHLEAFTDPLVECKVCHQRFRADKPEEIEAHTKSHGKEKVEWTEPMNFNLLVKSYLGVIEGKQQEIFLRGEITNGVHVNFKNVMDPTRVKIPFGIAQMGKAFRNEITPGNFIFRSREFEQMETQYYIKPEEKEGERWFAYWKENRMEWYLSLGFRPGKLRFKDHEPEKTGIMPKMPQILNMKPLGVGMKLWVFITEETGLSRHQQFSGKDMSVRDPETNETYLPWDIETSAGVDRTFLFLLFDSYREDNGRVFLALSPRIAPYKAAVFPLLANKPELVDLAKSIYTYLRDQMMVAWDDRGNIGKRYASQDEIGTPYCVTVDFDTLEDQAVTVRFRDTASQERVKIDDLPAYLQKKINE